MSRIKELKEKLSHRTAGIAKGIDDVFLNISSPQIFSEITAITADAKFDMELNLGCGHKPSADANVLNVDVRPLPGVHICCDIFNLPLFVPNGSMAKIFSSDFVEHFSWRDVPRLFSLTHALLRDGGEAEIVTPDMRLIMGRYLDAGEPKCNWQWVMYHLYGMQSYDENYHKCLFDFKSLAVHLSAFSKVIHEENANSGNHLRVRAIK